MEICTFALAAAIYLANAALSLPARDADKI